MADHGNTIVCNSVAEWEEKLQSAKASNRLVVVDFTATWCGPCRVMAPIFVELSKKLPNVMFLKVDVDELKTLAEDWGVEAMPTLLYLKEGQIVDKTVGARKDEFKSPASCLKLESHKYLSL